MLIDCRIPTLFQFLRRKYYVWTVHSSVTKISTCSGFGLELILVVIICKSIEFVLKQLFTGCRGQAMDSGIRICSRNQVSWWQLHINDLSLMASCNCTTYEAIHHLLYFNFQISVKSHAFYLASLAAKAFPTGPALWGFCPVMSNPSSTTRGCHAFFLR